MIHTLSFLFFGCFFLSMIFFPSQTFEGACNGLVLWFQTVLPTLLPFAIISNILISTNGVHIISRKIGFLFKRIFHTSSPGCYAIIVGFLCGYPMGAKTISDLVKSRIISKNEGQYLLSFCNNTSPMFIISYLVLQNFHDQDLILPSLCILFGTPVLCSFFFRKSYQTSKAQSYSSSDLPQKTTFDFLILDQAIMNGFETITRVGGYIILFSILFTLTKNLPGSVFFGYLELTNGIPFFMQFPFSYEVRFTLCLSLVSLGGFCSIIQTRAMIQDSGLSIRPYIKEKLITAMVTSLISYIYILFIHL